MLDGCPQVLLQQPHKDLEYRHQCTESNGILRSFPSVAILAQLSATSQGLEDEGDLACARSSPGLLAGATTPAVLRYAMIDHSSGCKGTDKVSAAKQARSAALGWSRWGGDSAAGEHAKG